LFLYINKIEENHYYYEILFVLWRGYSELNDETGVSHEQ